MATVREVYQYLDGLAPFSLQMDFDNAGFLVGRGDRTVTKILVSLDITEEVAAEAAEVGAELIVSHHPVIFHPARSVTDGGPDGRILLSLIEHGIAAICAHTNLDAVAGGVNDALAQKLGLVQIEQLHQDGVDASGRPYGIGRVGNTVGAPMYAPAFAAFVKEALGANGVRYVDARRPVRRVAVGGRRLRRHAAGRPGTGVRHLCHRGCQVQRLSGRQGPGGEPDRRGPLSHRAGGVPRTGQMAVLRLPPGGDCPHKSA